MTGSELLGDREFELIKEIFAENPAILYRYHPKARMVRHFEEAIARRLGVKFAHAVSSGTAAIEVALHAAGVRPGDEVVTTAFTFLAPIEAILKLGAIPVCVEIDETLHLSPAAVEAAITERTRAVCVVPMWGPCDMDGLAAVCRKRDIVMVEDSAQCLGGTYRGRPLGTFGRIGSFSLDFGKSITAGEGGFIVTDDEETYRRAAEYADHGHVHNPTVPRGEDGVRVPGFNYRMSELTGAVALGQLSRLDGILSRQREHNARLTARLAEIPGLGIRRTVDPAGETGDTIIVRLPSAEKAAAASKQLAQAGIGTKILPEAFRWHYAGAWQHIWSRVPTYDPDGLRQIWSRTYELLSSSVALAVLVKEDPAREEKIVHAFAAVVAAQP